MMSKDFVIYANLIRNHNLMLVNNALIYNWSFSPFVSALEVSVHHIINP